MQEYQRQFIEFVLQKNILSLGEFTLKSGRQSPYFFNAGQFKQGADLAKIGAFYAEAIQQSPLKFEVLFGPAYKGIPLVSAAAIALWERYQQDIPFAFNRKEAKNHGEKGILVGSDLKGKRVLLVDDVITAGTTIRESLVLLENYEAQLMGILILFDRQEKGQTSTLSAVQEVEANYHIPVLSIATLSHLMEYLKDSDEGSLWLPKIAAYQAQYGIKTVSF